MIFDFLFTGMLKLIAHIFQAIVNVPAIPQAFVNAGQAVLDMVTVPIGVLQLLFGDVLLTALVSVLLFIWSFRLLYNFTKWIIGFIPTMSS